MNLINKKRLDYPIIQAEVTKVTLEHEEQEQEAIRN